MYADKQLPPERFLAFIHLGAFGGIRAELQGENLAVTPYSQNGEPSTVTRLFVPSIWVWKRFMRRVEKDGVSIWNLHETYGERASRAYPRWEIEITLAGRTVVSRGAGRYPTAGGGSSANPTKRLLKLWRALTGLIAGEEDASGPYARPRPSGRKARTSASS
jgi:hypothetical protein